MKSYSFILVSAILFLSCGKDDKPVVKDTKPNTTTTTEKKTETPKTVDAAVNAELLVGSWITSEYKMGFDLMSGGKVKSINMATLDYNSWKIDGNKLILNSTSKGVSNPVTVDEVYIIRTVTADKIVLSRADDPTTNLTYTKK
ncbi:MAG: lipocalin family protein [bacterium]|nr:lipocalin family protein [bacterium]